jgi:hypothetical protein
MKSFTVDVAVRQFSKKGEDACGDAVKVSNTADSTIIVVSDGLGSGVKANVLATMTVELATGLFKGNLSLLEIVETLIATLPVCKWRNIAYSTFSIARIYDTGHLTVAEYDSPPLIYIPASENHPQLAESTECTLLGKTIRESRFRLNPNDMIMIYSDGIVYAGVGEGLPMGWQEEGILDYLAKTVPTLDGDVQQLANCVADTALDFWHNRPGDDGTVLCAKYRKAQHATVLTGPPTDPTLVPKMLRDFMAKEGKKIVCGGTTSHLVADYLGKELVLDERYLDTGLPPIASLPGIDLVTEGILTLSRATEYLSKGRPKDHFDAATALLDELESVDGILFMVGTARNPAHQNTGLPDSIFLRRTVVENLAKQLEARGKETELVYY